jgi:hypothetical protein
MAGIFAPLASTKFIAVPNRSNSGGSWMPRLRGAWQPNFHPPRVVRRDFAAQD